MKKLVHYRRGNYYNPIKYENKYNTDNCKKENEEIENILSQNVKDKFTHITDIGCGTGLGRKLLENILEYKALKYLGVDNQHDMIRWCKNKYKNIFYYVDAETYIYNITRLDTVISLFSLNYMKPKTIEGIWRKMDDKFIAIHYNKPYLCKNSAYYNEKLYFCLIHFIKKLRIKYIFFKLGAKTYKLLGQDYYYVTILEKNKINCNELESPNFPINRRKIK